MNNQSKLVELEFNELYGGAITDYWWVFLIVIVIIGAIVAVLMMNKDSSKEDDDSDDGTLESSSNVSKSSSSVSDESIGFRTNEAGEREYYKIVDGEERELTEQDYKNLEEQQKAIDNIKNTSYGNIAGINIDQIVADSTSNADITSGATAGTSASSS